MHEALWMSYVGCAKRAVADGEPLGDATVMYVGRRQHAEARMPVLVVVPVEKQVGPLPGILEAAEAIWEVGAVLQCFELSFGERVVVGS